MIPRALDAREIAHGGLTELLVVETMHQRKALMAERADAFVALPGGVGTIEELIEALTWTQLRIHDKPVGLLDAGGYWGPLRAMLDWAVEAAFVRPATAHAAVRRDPAALLTPWRRGSPRACRSSARAQDLTRRAAGLSRARWMDADGLRRAR